MTAAATTATAASAHRTVVFISGNMPMRTEITPLLIITKLEQYDYRGATAIAVVMLTIVAVLVVGGILLHVLLVGGLLVWGARRLWRAMQRSDGNGPAAATDTPL